MAYHPFRHLGLKALSIGIAVLLWLTVAGEPVVERNLRVPLEVQNVPAQLMMVESPPAFVEARVRGASSVLRGLRADDVLLILDLSQARAGSQVFHLTPNQVRVPSWEIQVTQVVPASVSLTLEALATRVVPVTPVIEGQPAEGYVRGDAVTAPRTVEVAGPESALRRLDDVATEAVSIEGATASVAVTAAIGIADPRLRLTTVRSVQVRVEVRPVLSERAMAGVPVHLRNVRTGLKARVAPAAVSVVVRGPVNALSALKSEAVVAYADLAGLGPGRYNLPIRVELPQAIDIVRTQPATVSVTIR
jgi:YbbR domain-containing protein